MNSPESLPVQKRINVLTLDGGGVRGLSSLLILDELMRQINDRLQDLSHSSDLHSNLLPHHIFDLAAGTSTGGLISLMLGKLGMSVKDCIKEYSNLSKDIFKRKQLLAVRGIARPKYSGSKLEGCVRGLVGRHRSKENLNMLFNEKDKIACAVVCREYENDSLKGKAVCICSLPCAETDRVVCPVYQAARATSAAPTYFPVQKIADRCFVDGGLQFNNPSHAIFQHYSQSILVKESQTKSATESVPHAPSHGKLNFTKVRIINLGTGTKSDASSTRPSFMKRIMPGARNATFLANIVREIVPDAEYVAEVMTMLAGIRGEYPHVKFERFSADTGVAGIKMDRYKDLEKIEKWTQIYLDTPKVETELKRVAEEIAREYLDTQAAKSRSAGLASPEQEPPRLPPSVVQPLDDPHTPQQQLDYLSSFHMQSSDCTIEPETLNQSSTRTLVEPSPVPFETSSSSPPKFPLVKKSSQNGNREPEVDVFC